MQKAITRPRRYTLCIWCAALRFSDCMGIFCAIYLVLDVYICWFVVILFGQRCRTHLEFQSDRRTLGLVRPNATRKSSKKDDAHLKLTAQISCKPPE